MGDGKESKRVRDSKARLMRALCELLADRQLSEISVSQLCDHAGVGRSTFYRHYHVPGDILVEYFGELFQSNVTLSFGPGTTPPTNAQAYRIMFSFCEAYHANRELLSAKSAQELSGIIRSALPAAARTGAAPADARELSTYAFVAGGVATLVMQWAARDFAEPVEQVASITADLIVRCLGQRSS